MTAQLIEVSSPVNQNSRQGERITTGRLIVNADDWGRSVDVTDRIAECMLQKVVSSASAMVFMEDSERGAALASRENIDTGLHLNLTTEFSSSACPPRLREEQGKLIRFLSASRIYPAVYHPGLTRTFEFVVQSQLQEYARLYRKPPLRIDGHHHMHLCANVQIQKLLPKGTIVRRNFSFAPGEKNALNRFYRRWQDRRLAKRHRMTDFFFPLLPIDRPGRLETIVALANRFTVEIETHPVNRNEYDFLIAGFLARKAWNIGVSSSYSLS